MPSAFVVQPILDSADPAHAHFRGIYARIRDVLGDRGYTCIRSDEVDRSGAITKDIVLRLSAVDLVVADLTDLNPNVYYELGVRHALRSSGTILILDEDRTEQIPFDLSAYRVIHFEGTVAGISRLEERLADAIDHHTEFGPTSDNPVHDWLPELPPNALAAADGSEAGEMRRQLKAYEEYLSRYKDRFGPLDSTFSSPTSTPLSVVMKAVADAKEGTTPTQLGRASEQAVQDRDPEAFLDVVRRVLENEVRVDVRTALSISLGAVALGLDEVSSAVLEYAMSYLDDVDLEKSALAKAAHSSDPEERARARVELARKSGLEAEADGQITIPTDLTTDQSDALIFLLDVLHQEKRYKEAFALSYEWVLQSPDSVKALRNLGRSYAVLEEGEMARLAFRRSLAVSDVDDTTAKWLGNGYHNSGEPVNALEAFVCAALRDPNDGLLFAHVAEELSVALENRLLGRAEAGGRSLPDEISNETFAECIQAVMSCTTPPEEAISRTEAAVRRMNASVVPPGQEDKHMDLKGRYELVSGLYSVLQSDATAPLQSAPDAGWPDLREGREWADLSIVGAPESQVVSEASA